MSTPLLSFRKVAKQFDGIFALRDVTFDVFEGECVALVGENGAGKSTLMKILSGVWPRGSYGGEVCFEGQPLSVRNPLESRKLGISIIHQELCLFSQLTVAENLFLTEAFPYDGTPSQALFSRVHWDSLFERAASLFRELGFDVDPRAKIEDLSVAQRQLVEIAKAVHHRAKVLILDEPTSALSKKEVEQLFAVIARMRQSKVTFLYISHKFDEVFRLADRIVVLRDGQAVSSLLPRETTEAEVIRHMVGRPLKGGARPEACPEGNPLLEVRGLAHRDPWGKMVLGGIDFDLRAGEILGVAGLMGSGRSELLRSLLGVLPGVRQGTIRYQGVPAGWAGIEQAMEAGIAFVPEDRKKDGLFLDHGIDFNMTITLLKRLAGKGGVLDLGEERNLVAKLIRDVGVKCRDAKSPVRNLSGGNQQKVLLSKVMARSPKVLLLDEPTRGIDVGAKEEIYEIIRGLARRGIAVVLVSSELPEILALSHRVLVLREGRLAGELANVDLGQERIMALAAAGGSQGAIPVGAPSGVEVPHGVS